MSDHFELLDVYKAGFAIIAGLILGAEREMKDKSAGLKTITIICLGSALFAIMSYKMAGDGDPTRIASYIVSGIGFLGAGVIFKSGFAVYGLTTAGIIWIAAAIGMAIGFGELYIALTFLAGSQFVIYTAKVLTKYFLKQHQNKILKLKFPVNNFSDKAQIINEISAIAKEASTIELQKDEDNINLTIELYINAEEIELLENYLVENKNIRSFSF